MARVFSLFDFCESAGMPHHGMLALIEHLNDRIAAETAVCQARTQRRSAAPLPERRALGDFGRVEAAIDKISFFKWGQRLGFDCWEDDGFMREYLRDNPHARVKTVPDKTRVLVNWAGHPVR